jgi:hypothetical protein
MAKLACSANAWKGALEALTGSPPPEHGGNLIGGSAASGGGARLGGD